MIPDVRAEFNAKFRQETYDAFLRDLNTAVKYPADFRVCETPIFLPREFVNALLTASNQVIDVTRRSDYRAQVAQAIPPGYAVRNEADHPLFLQIDFAVCIDEHGQHVPRLIELQGFPSLYCFQAMLDYKIADYFDLPSGFSVYFSGLDYTSYITAVRRAILGGHDPEQTITLEVTPEKQGTRIDMACVEAMIGVPTVALSEVYTRGRGVFYRRDGREIRVTRIYNRIIREDERLVDKSDTAWMGEDLNVSWAGHPNWYYKISKYALPLFHRYGVESAPECYYVDELSAPPPDLDQFVLKPLYLFSGSGVQLDVTPAMLDALPDRRNYILQRKVQYAPAVLTPDGYSSAEIRMLYLWEDQPVPVSTLVRMSKGRMMGVKFNKDKTWVGSSIAYLQG